MPRVRDPEHRCLKCNKVNISSQAKYQHNKFCKGVGDNQVLKDELARVKCEMEKLQEENVALKLLCQNQPVFNNHIVINNYINNFRSEDTGHLKHEYIKKLNKGPDLSKSLQELIVNLHYDRVDMNVFLGGQNEKHGYWHRGDSWTRVPTNKLATRVIINSCNMMMEHEDDPYGDEYTPEQNERFERFHQNAERDQLHITIKTLASNSPTFKEVYPEICNMF
jgi:hypothetical protein